MNIDASNTCAVVLAAGKGTRMKAGNQNKVTLKVAGKPIIQRIIERIREAGVKKIFVVVGHEKESVESVLKDSVTYVHQKEQLGTGHAVQVALDHIPPEFKNVFVFYGDDTSYPQQDLLNLFDQHKKDKNVITFLTFILDNPTGYGRIKRGSDNKVVGIVEEKNATEVEKEIKEINPGCFLFDRQFLNVYISQIPLNPIKKEYYLTDMIEIGVKNKQKIEGVIGDGGKWQGINSPEELKKAEQHIQQ